MTPVQAFELILMLLAVAVVFALVARKVNIPPAAAFVIGGIVIAVTPGHGTLRLDPELTLVLFLPPLLQSSAFFTSWRDFMSNLRPILLLAIGATVFTTLAVGWILKSLIPELPWAACFTFGAIISPPDAVTAAAVLERLRIPRRLSAILLGESLVNDASGIVLYQFAVAATLTGAFNPAAASLEFLYVAVAGVAVGIAFGHATVWIVHHLKNAHLEIATTFLVAWTSYIAAERIGASGVLSTVACGLWAGWRQHTLFTPETRLQAAATWSFVTFVLEALVFILIGLSLRGVLDRLGESAAIALLPLAFEVVAAATAVRFVWVMLATYIPRWTIPYIRRTDPAPPFAQPVVVAWAGMRGVVSLAVALALPEGFPGRDLILFLTFVLILVTVLVQGTTLGPLIKALGIAMPKEEDPQIMDALARAKMAQARLAYIEERSRDDLEGAIAQDLLPEYRDRAQEISLSPARSAARRAERLGRLNLRLEALQAARESALRLNRAGELHDSVLLGLERELDLEELRLRQDLRRAA